jgi:DNA-directed RNA polymerase subunit M/transcription elongation factor TFIIS
MNAHGAPVVTRCERCGNMHHSASPRISRSPSLGMGVFVLCERCFQTAGKDSVYRCDRCGNQEASVSQRKRYTATGATMLVPLCDHCDWATEWRKRPERLPYSTRVQDWAALVAGILLILLPALSIPRLEAFVKTYHASVDAQALSTRLYATRLHAEQNFTRTRIVLDSSGGLLRVEKFDRKLRQWQPDGEPLKLSSGVQFGFGQASMPPPGFRSLHQSGIVMFNSRGMPINDVAESVADYMVYITNGAWTYGIAVSPAGHISVWRFENGSWSQS